MIFKLYGVCKEFWHPNFEIIPLNLMFIFFIKVRNYHLIKKSSTSHKMQCCEHLLYFSYDLILNMKRYNKGTCSSIQMSLFTMCKDKKDISLLQWLWKYPINKFTNWWCFDNRLIPNKPGVDKVGSLSNSQVISVTSSVRKWLLLETRISFQWIVLLFVSCCSTKVLMDKFVGFFEAGN